jgi:hypothetical protein
MEVLSLPVGPFPPFPITRKRVTFEGLSSIPSEMTASPYRAAAALLPMAAPSASSRTRRAAFAVLSVSWSQQ